MISNEWLAGFFDGEGSIGITVAGKHRRCILRLTLVNTDYELLSAIQRWHGGLLNRRAVKADKPHWKQFCSLTWTNKQAEILISRIAPYVILKRKQLELAKEFLSLKTDANRFEVGSLPHLAVRERNFVRRIRPEMLAREAEIKTRLHLLNKKGRAA